MLHTSRFTQTLRIFPGLEKKFKKSDVKAYRKYLRRLQTVNNVALDTIPINNKKGVSRSLIPLLFQALYHGYPITKLLKKAKIDSFEVIPTNQVSATKYLRSKKDTLTVKQTRIILPTDEEPKYDEELKQLRTIGHQSYAEYLQKGSPYLAVCLGRINLEGKNYLVTEDAELGNLQRMLGCDFVVLKHQISFMLDIIKALTELHQYNIVHTSLHPRNVLVTSSWHCKLTDANKLPRHSPWKFDKLKQQFFPPELKEKELEEITSEMFTKPMNIFTFAQLCIYIFSKTKQNDNDINTSKFMPSEFKYILKRCFFLN